MHDYTKLKKKEEQNTSHCTAQMNFNPHTQLELQENFCVRVNKATVLDVGFT